jgi:hypothetical protein
MCRQLIFAGQTAQQVSSLYNKQKTSDQPVNVRTGRKTHVIMVNTLPDCIALTEELFVAWFITGWELDYFMLRPLNSLSHVEYQHACNGFLTRPSSEQKFVFARRDCEDCGSHFNKSNVGLRQDTFRSYSCSSETLYLHGHGGRKERDQPIKGLGQSGECPCRRDITSNYSLTTPTCVRRILVQSFTHYHL